ncbi:MAG TPA: energy-coupling factor transporter transmembrane protein EcfT [Limnochorda sp.]
MHRADPRAKLLALLLLVGALTKAQSARALAAAALVVALGAAAGRVPWRVLARALGLVGVLLLVTLAFNLFLTPGAPLFHLGPLQATRRGLERGLLLAARLGLLALAGGLLTATTPPLALSRGLERLLAPLGRLGLRVPDLSLILAIALEFIPLLADEARRLALARRARGALGGGSWLARVQESLAVLPPLFVAAVRRADRLAEAMEARGYRGARRGSLHPLRWRSSDWLVVGLPGLYLVWVWLLR